MSDHHRVQHHFRLLHALADVQPDARRSRRQLKRQPPSGLRFSVTIALAAMQEREAPGPPTRR